MKVMCIDASGKTDFGCASPLVEGDTYTASQCPIYDESYKLVEIPTNELGHPISFRKRRFIPLSNIDEMEVLENERQLVSSN